MLEGTSLLNEDNLPDEEAEIAYLPREDVSRSRRADRLHSQRAARAAASSSTAATLPSGASSSGASLGMGIGLAAIPPAVQATVQETADLALALSQQWREDVTAMRQELAELRRDICTELRAFNSNFSTFTQRYNTWSPNWGREAQQPSTSTGATTPGHVSVSTQANSKGLVRQNTADAAVNCPSPVELSVMKSPTPEPLKSNVLQLPQPGYVSQTVADVSVPESALSSPESIDLMAECVDFTLHTEPLDVQNVIDPQFPVESDIDFLSPQSRESWYPEGLSSSPEPVYSEPVSPSPEPVGLNLTESPSPEHIEPTFPTQPLLEYLESDVQTLSSPEPVDVAASNQDHPDQPVETSLASSPELLQLDLSFPEPPPPVTMDPELLAMPDLDTDSLSPPEPVTFDSFSCPEKLSALDAVAAPAWSPELSPEPRPESPIESPIECPPESEVISLPDILPVEPELLNVSVSSSTETVPQDEIIICLTDMDTLHHAVLCAVEADTPDSNSSESFDEEIEEAQYGSSTESEIINVASLYSEEPVLDVPDQDGSISREDPEPRSPEIVLETVPGAESGSLSPSEPSTECLFGQALLSNPAAQCPFQYPPPELQEPMEASQLLLKSQSETFESLVSSPSCSDFLWVRWQKKSQGPLPLQRSSSVELWHRKFSNNSQMSYMSLSL